MTTSDFIVERLIELGIQHVFGVGGANIEDLFSAVQRRRPQIRAILGKHEHAAGAAAEAYARLRGWGVVLTTSGGGAMNVVHALAEARASRTRVLAIIGEPPTILQGRGAFQDTSGKGEALVDALSIFKAAVGGRAFRIARIGDVPDVWDAVIEAVLEGPPGPVVLLLAKDIQTADVVTNEVALHMRGAAARNTSGNLTSVLASNQACAIVAGARAMDHGSRTVPIAVIAGNEVSRSARAREGLDVLVNLLDARVVTTPDGRDAFNNRSARFEGVCGAMGHASAKRALEAASLVLVIGTGLPILARQGLESILRAKKLVFVSVEAPLIERSAPADALVHVAVREPDEIALVLHRFVEAAKAADNNTGAEDIVMTSSSHLDEMPPALASGRSSASTFGSANVLCLIDRMLPRGAIVLVDAGNTGASAIHHVRAPELGRFLVAMGMAGMGYTFGAAIGAALASGGQRCVVIAGDGAFFMNGLDVHTAIEHALPITYVVLNNRAHGMCLVRERVLMGESSGYNSFRPSHIGAGMAAMFPTLPAADCTTASRFEELFSKAMTTAGPSLIAVELEDVEVPPFGPFQERAPDMITVKRGNGS